MNRHMPDYNKNLIPTAKMLRRRMTHAERRLWSHIRGNKLGVKFRRQVPFGPYITDFYCHKARLVVELDGDQHSTQAGLAADHKRDIYFGSIGIMVVRYRNIDMTRNTDGVVGDIVRILNECRGVRSNPDFQNESEVP